MNDALHDHFFRAIFSVPVRAGAEFRFVLPPAVTAALDWPTLATVPGTFVDDELRGRAADLLFTVRRRDGGDALVHLLFEHQSTFDRWLPLRLLEYQARIWERWRRDHPRAEKLPRIVAVVLHQGEQPWPVAAHFRDLLEGSRDRVPDPLDATSVDFRFLVDDLAACSDAQIRGRALDAVALLALLSLRHARSSRDLGQLMVEWATLFNAALVAPGGRAALLLVLRYLSRVKDVRGPELFTEARLPMVAPEVRAMGMTAADRWIEQGRQKGLQQGRQQGRQQGQVDAERAVLRRLLAKRFGAIASDVERRIAAAAPADLERWIERVLDAPSAEAVVAD